MFKRRRVYERLDDAPRRPLCNRVVKLAQPIVLSADQCLYFARVGIETNQGNLRFFQRDAVLPLLGDELVDFPACRLRPPRRRPAAVADQALCRSLNPNPESPDPETSAFNFSLTRSTK